MRLIRGAGPAGLAGIRPRAGRVVEPLLDISRAELRQYAAEHGLGFATIRPTPTCAFRATACVSSCCRSCRGLTRDCDARARGGARPRGRGILDRLAIESAASIVLVESGSVTVDVAGLTALPPALASRVTRKAVAAAAPGRFIGFQHIDDLLELARSGAEGAAAALLA